MKVNGLNENRNLYLVGFITSILVTLSIVMLFAATIYLRVIKPDPIFTWTNIADYAKIYTSDRVLDLIPSMFLAITFVPFAACIYLAAPKSKKIFGLISLAFGIIYSVIDIINYTIQLLVINPSMLMNQTEGIEMFAMARPNSAYLALMTSYVYMVISIVFMAPTFEKGKIEKWIKTLLYLNLVFIVVGVVGMVIGAGYITIFGSLLPWCIAFPTSLILISITFYKKLKSKSCS